MNSYSTKFLSVHSQFKIITVLMIYEFDKQNCIKRFKVNSSCGGFMRIEEWKEGFLSMTNLYNWEASIFNAFTKLISLLGCSTRGCFEACCATVCKACCWLLFLAPAEAVLACLFGVVFFCSFVRVSAVFVSAYLYCWFVSWPFLQYFCSRLSYIICCFQNTKLIFLCGWLC